MTRQYIVGFSESAIEDIHLTVVYAENAEHALDKFAAAVGISERKFVEFVYERSVDDVSLAESLWLQDEFEQEEYGRAKELPVSDEEFKQRVREFFGENQDFANLYLDYYFGDADPGQAAFPPEMLIYIWYEAEWADVFVVAQDDLPVID